MDPFIRFLDDYPEDIQAEIARSFASEEQIARKLIKEHIAAEPTADRILRCILFLASGDINKLRAALELHLFDGRDVIFAAEYDEVRGRVRDFNDPFPNVD